MTQPLPPQPDPTGLTAADLAGIAGIVLAYQQATQAVRDHLENLVRGVWWSLGQYRDGQRAEFTARIVPMVEAAMAQMSSLTSGYLAATEQTRTSQLVVPSPVAPPTISRVRNGADPSQVYGRPFGVVWQHLAEAPHRPGEVDKAIEMGVNRAVNLAVTDLQLAKTHTAQRTLEAAPRPVVGYRRVLEGPHSCGKCIVASTRVYHRAKLMPIHPGCDCGVAEVYGDADPAAQVNDHLVGGVHAAIAERFGRSDSGAGLIPGQDGLAYRNILIEHTDGEIGPILGIRGQSFRGPSDLKGAA